MYSKLKQIILGIIPRSILFKLEPFLRTIYHRLFYKGDSAKCNICNSSSKAFIEPLGICPACGSLPRNRRLWQILDDNYLNPELNILDFSPSRCLYRKHKQNNYRYLSTDLSGDFIADECIDITNISYPNETFDIIICYHILEHVIEDKKAMAELFRTLKLNGICIIQTPFKEGNIYEDYSISSPEEREKHFGQDDHVRYYSVNGLSQRLSEAEFKIKELSFSEKPENPYGFDENETVLICSKS